MWLWITLGGALVLLLLVAVVTDLGDRKRGGGKIRLPKRAQRLGDRPIDGPPSGGVPF